VDDRPQTNLHFLTKLRRTGYPADDVERVKAAYDFVSGHFAGWFLRQIFAGLRRRSGRLLGRSA